MFHLHDPQYEANPGPTTVGQMAMEAWYRAFKPIRPYVIQLCVDGRRVHHHIGPGDVTEWCGEMFGSHTRPLKNVWYAVPPGLWTGLYTDDGEYDNLLVTILFYADGYAQNRFERSRIDPRQKPFRGTASTRLFPEHEPAQCERLPDVEDAARATMAR